MPQLQHEFCTVPNCGRPHKARGYCQAHYQHHLRGVPIKAEIKTRDTTPFDKCTEADCLEPVKAKGLCHMHYARLLRHGHTRYPDRKRPPKPCSVSGCENHRYSKGMCHQHYIQERSLSKNYGITPQDFTRMFAEQNGVCAICNGINRQTNSQSGKTIDLNVDHDHATGKVRGLLCSHCNRGIGLLGDSIETLRSAIAYLEQHSV